MATAAAQQRLPAARAYIARAKAIEGLRKADELLVCAALAYRDGEYDRVATRCAEAMGKIISRPSQVTDWVGRLERLDKASVDPRRCSCRIRGSRRTCQV